MSTGAGKSVGEGGLAMWVQLGGVVGGGTCMIKSGVGGTAVRQAGVSGRNGSTRPSTHLVRPVLLHIPARSTNILSTPPPTSHTLPGHHPLTPCSAHLVHPVLFHHPIHHQIEAVQPAVQQGQRARRGWR